MRCAARVTVLRAPQDSVVRRTICASAARPCRARSRPVVVRRASSDATSFPGTRPVRTSSAVSSNRRPLPAVPGTISVWKGLFGSRRLDQPRRLLANGGVTDLIGRVLSPVSSIYRTNIFMSSRPPLPSRPKSSQQRPHPLPCLPHRAAEGMHHRQLQQARPDAAGRLRRRHLRLVEQQVLEPGQPWQSRVAAGNRSANCRECRQPVGPW